MTVAPETDNDEQQLIRQYDQLRERLRTAIERDRKAGTTLADGWPRGHADGPGNGASITVDDEHGDPDTIPVTSVELATLARQHPQRDPHRELVIAAIRQAERAVEAIIRRDTNTLRSAIARLDGLLTGIDQLATGPALIDEGEPGCASCNRYLDAVGRPLYSPRFRGDLCQWCYGWVNDTEINPKRRQPPLGLLARRARGEKITTAVIAETLKR